MKPKWNLEEKKRDLQRLYTRLLPILRQVARRSGYALAVHGSMIRDLDLIAVPWIKKPVLPDTLRHRLCVASCGLKVDSLKDPWTIKPHGRRAASIHIGMHAYLDLSVVPFQKGHPQ